MTLDPAAVAAKMRGMDTPQEKARVFFALWPKPQERTALAAWQAGLQRLCGGRVMQPDTLHTTLVFLGEVAANQMEALQCAAREVALEPFELRFDAARYWGHNHVVLAAPGVAPAPLPFRAAPLPAACHAAASCAMERCPPAGDARCMLADK